MKYYDSENLFIHRKYEPDKEHRPSGFTLTETICSMIILGALLVFMVTSFRLVDVQTRRTEMHQLAMNEASNLMENLSSRSWNDLTPETAKSVKISESTRNMIPDAKLSAEIIQPEQTPDAKKISIQISYKHLPGQADPVVSLTTWVYQQESAE